LLALGATIAYRFAICGSRQQRLLRQSFALYLAPEVIEKLMGVAQAAGARRAS